MFPRKAEKYSPEAVEALLNLSIDHNRECLDVAVTVLTIFTSMRIEDVTGIFCDNVDKVAFVSGVPRHLKFILEQTKNDIQGLGPISGRTFLLPCLCSTSQSVRDNLRFSKLCRAEPFVVCPVLGCPFKVIFFFFFFLSALCSDARCL